MRPMTETRKRRLSDPPQLATKRLSNGCIKTDHVTTRSQAKNDPGPRLSPSRKVKHKQLTIEERRLMISMRLRHEEKNSVQSIVVQQPPQSEKIRKLEKSRCTIPILNTNGRTTNGLSCRLKNKVRSKVLASITDHQNEIWKSEEEKRAREAEKRENRAKKRRSALWVLNCEAEEFLFGETAAEDHEVELPPISASPPKKRRRMRATELGDLLKETPLLESKLRQAPASSDSESSTTHSYTDRKKKLKKSRGVRTKNSSDRVKRKLEADFTSSYSTTEDDEVFEDDYENKLKIFDFPNLSLVNPVESGCSLPRDASQSVRIQRILQSIPYTFFFESVPSSEVWYRTFIHQDRPRDLYLGSTESPVTLPYESKNLNRESTKRMRRPPRKSPRCHASTQAILSSFKPTRSGQRQLQLAITSPPSSPIPSTSKAILTQLPSPSPVIQPQSEIEKDGRIIKELKLADLSGTQYLWDSIQFLCDSYVINVLNQSPRPYRTTKSCFHKFINRSKLELLEKSSKKNHFKDQLSLIIPSPKTSPRYYNNSNGNCSKGIVNYSPIGSGKSKSLRSPPPLPPPPSSVPIPVSLTSPNLRKSPRKSMLLETVSEKPSNVISTNKFKSMISPKSTKDHPQSHLLFHEEEESIFSIPTETLPNFQWEFLSS